MLISPDGALTDLSLFLAGFVTWMISTISAGGGSVLMVASASTLLAGHAVAPVVTVTSAIANPTRIILFWRHTDWRVVAWYVPGAIAGAAIGGWMFTQVSANFLQLCVGLFLVSTAWQYRLGRRERSFSVSLPWFVPVSIAVGATSAIVGASGLFGNPFYLNYGLIKERMIATRAINSTVVQITKIGAYTTFGVMQWELVRHGLVAGAGAALAIWATRPVLKHLDPRRFRQIAVFVMLASGLLILWNQRDWISGYFTS